MVRRAGRQAAEPAPGGRAVVCVSAGEAVLGLGRLCSGNGAVRFEPRARVLAQRDPCLAVIRALQLEGPRVVAAAAVVVAVRPVRGAQRQAARGEVELEGGLGGGKGEPLQFGAAWGGLQGPGRAFKTLRRRYRLSVGADLSLPMVQGGRWGGVVSRQGGCPFQCSREALGAPLDHWVALAPGWRCAQITRAACVRGLNRGEVSARSGRDRRGRARLRRDRAPAPRRPPCVLLRSSSSWPRPWTSAPETEVTARSRRGAGEARAEKRGGRDRAESGRTVTRPASAGLA